jgi:hypothetical protein
MSSTRQASKAAKSTINYHRISLDEHQLFEPDALITKDQDANHQPRRSPQSGRTYTDRRLTTPHFVSALAGIWNLVGQPESSGTTQRPESHGISSRDDPVCFSRDQQGHILTPCCVESSGDLRSHNCFSTPKSIYEDLSSVKKMLMLAPFSGILGASSTWSHMHAISKIGAAHHLQCRNIYSMQTEKRGTTGTSRISKRSICEETYAASTNMDIGDDNYSSQTRSTPAELCTSSNEKAETAYDCESSLHETESNLEFFHDDPNHSASSGNQIEIVKEGRIMSGNQISSKACIDAQLDTLAGMSCLVADDVVLHPANVDKYAYGDDMSLQHSVDKWSHERQPTLEHRFDAAVTINRHAVAGALAGTAVSVSLHPLDTVKTIIQANSSGRSSFYHTLRRTLVERGNVQQ